MTISTQAIEKITTAVINQMVLEAAYKGETVTGTDIVMAILTDSEGDTAAYFNKSVADSVEMAVRMKSDPDLLSVFS